MGENAEIRNPYRFESQDVQHLDTTSASIICYKGDDVNPRWMDVDARKELRDARDFIADTALLDLYVPLCTIAADTSKVYKKPQRAAEGKYFVQEYDIVLMCGSTEMRAFISWMENVRAVPILSRTC